MKVSRMSVVELDLKGYSDVARLLEDNLDAKAVAALNKQIQRFVKTALAGLFDIRPIAKTGDGAILAFARASDAHRFAVAVHEATCKHNASRATASAHRRFRIGITTGNLAIENNTVEGGATIGDAVRLEAAASTGQILIDVATYEELPPMFQSLYGAVETVPGKRDETFQVHRYTVVETPVEVPEPKATTGLPPTWNVPHASNRFFTGRDVEMNRLRVSLESNQAAAVTQAIAGNGGIGKTTLAVEYCYAFAGKYTAIWWLHAELASTLIDDLAQLAVQLKLAAPDERDLAAAAKAALHWLNHNSGWLLIFDNAADPALCKEWLPHSTTGHTIITTRDRAWERIAASLSLPVLDRTAAVELLQTQSGKSDASNAGRICAELGDLPLALEQAGTYIRELGVTFAEYLSLLAARKSEMTSGVAVSLAITLDRLPEQALELLHLIAFFAPEDIPRTLLAGRISDALQRNEAIATLRRYSLIDFAGDNLNCHRLVQSVVRDRLGAAGQISQWAQSAVELMRREFPFRMNEVETWAPSGQLVTHALAAAQHAEAEKVGLAEAAYLYSLAGLYFRNRGQLGDALLAARRALAIDEQVYGPHHPTVATDANNIGTILKAQGDLAGALEYARRALSIFEQVYGPDHPSTRTVRNNLADITKVASPF